MQYLKAYGFVTEQLVGTQLFGLIGFWAYFLNSYQIFIIWSQNLISMTFVYA
jgi:hypothetical protein